MYFGMSRLFSNIQKLHNMITIDWELISNCQPTNKVIVNLITYTTIQYDHQVVVDSNKKMDGKNFSLFSVFPNLLYYFLCILFTNIRFFKTKSTSKLGS